MLIPEPMGPDWDKYGRILGYMHGWSGDHMALLADWF